MPKGQRNLRTSLCLLALLNIKQDTPFSDAQNPLLGITPIMEFITQHYRIRYAPNTRETIRRQSIHQLLQAGILQYNPDDSSRATNSPNAVYQVTPEFLRLVRNYGSSNWESSLHEFQSIWKSLSTKYAMPRLLKSIPVVSQQINLTLSPGKHNELIKSIIEVFAPTFLLGAELVYVGDTKSKTAFINKNLIDSINISLDPHDKLPDVVFCISDRKWIIFVESVTSHGPMDSKRFHELNDKYSSVDYDLIFVTAFRDRETFARYSAYIAWETEVWIENNPDHMIHFNGSKFLGPYHGSISQKCI